MNNRIVTIDGKKGEYTGSSNGPEVLPWEKVPIPRRVHYFSMYNGEVIKKGSFDGVVFDDGLPAEDVEAIPEL